MGYQAEQRVLAVLDLNKGSLGDSKAGAVEKMWRYMAVRYHRNSVNATLTQMERKGWLTLRTGAVRTGGSMIVSITRTLNCPHAEQWAIEELQKAIHLRTKVKMSRGRTDVRAPDEWLDENRPKEEAAVGAEPQPQVAAQPPASHHSTEEEPIDYRQLADALLLEVLDNLNGGVNEAELQEAQADAARLSKELQSVMSDRLRLEGELEEARRACSEAERTLRQQKQTINGKDEALRSEKRKRADAELELNRLQRELVDATETARRHTARYEEMERELKEARAALEKEAVDLGTSIGQLLDPETRYALQQMARQARPA